MRRKYKKKSRSSRKRMYKKNPHYKARWGLSGSSLGNVSFEARSDSEAERKAEKIAEEIGLTRTPYTISKSGGRTWVITPERSYNPRHRRLGVPEKHQLKIAYQTLRMPDAMARVMGGPNKAEAREIIKRLTGRTPRGNPCGCRHKNPSAAFDVYLRGKKIDTVFQSLPADADYVKRSLVNHDGYDPAIVVRRRRAKRK